MGSTCCQICCLVSLNFSTTSGSGTDLSPGRLVFVQRSLQKNLLPLRVICARLLQIYIALFICMQFSFSKHDYVTYATSYAFNILLPAALYTSPCLHWSLFYILGRFWVQIYCSKILQNFCSKLGGGADVCPPGVTMCVHPVSLARRTWIGRTSAGPILILWGGE